MRKAKPLNWNVISFFTDDFSAEHCNSQHPFLFCNTI
jgi:hypothetical protein